MSAVVTRDVVTVPDSAPVRRPRKRWTRFILPVFTIGMIVYLAFPVFVMILYSFNIVENRQSASVHVLHPPVVEADRGDP